MKSMGAFNIVRLLILFLFLFFFELREDLFLIFS